MLNGMTEKQARAMFALHIEVLQRRGHVDSIRAETWSKVSKHTELFDGVVSIRLPKSTSEEGAQEFLERFQDRYNRIMSEASGLLEFFNRLHKQN